MASPSIVPIARDGAYPLSFAQQRLWLLDRLQPGNSLYNVPLAARLEGVLRVDLLGRSFQHIIQRHESLRTVFQTHEDQAVQIIQPEATYHIRQIDFSWLPINKRERELQRALQKEIALPFNLESGPLLRISIFRLQEQEHVLLIVMHHIISDAWSVGIMLRELIVCYEAFMQNSPVPLPDLPIQYVDFAYWQRQWLQGDVLKAHLSYWLERLEGAVPLRLPSDHPPFQQESHRGGFFYFSIPEDLSRQLTTFSQQEGATLFMTLFAAFQVLLYRYTGQEDMVIGTDIAHRTRTEIEGLIGFFVNILPLRTYLRDDLHFREVVGRVRSTVLEAYAHQDLPFDKLIEGLKLERDAYQVPLVQALFVLQNTPIPTLAIQELQIHPLELEAQTTRFNLGIFLREGPRGLSGYVNYRSDLFEHYTIVKMVERFKVLLASILSHPASPLTSLEIYTTAEQAQVSMKEKTRLETQRRKLKAARRNELDAAIGNETTVQP